MYKLLLIDDEPIILEGLKIVIDWAEYGIEITGEFTSAHDALKSLEAQKTDIIITDIKMPDMNGLELIKKAKQSGINAKIIVLSGFDDFAYVKEAARLGIENYLLKPVNAEELSLTLQNAIEKIDREVNQKIIRRNDLSVLKDNILYRWITGNIGDMELRERAELLEINLESEYYVVCIVKILKKKDNYEKRADSESISKNLETFSVNIVINGLNGEIIIILNLKKAEINKELIKNTLKDCMSNIKNDISSDVFITIGSIQSSYENVPKSYEEALELMEYSFILPPDSIVDFDDIKLTLGEKESNFSKDMSAFKNYVLSGDKAKVLLFIDDIFIKMGNDKGLTPAYIKSAAAEIIFILQSSSSSMNIIRNQRNVSETSIHKAFEIKTLSELANWVKAYAIDLLNPGMPIHNCSPIIERIVDFIDRNYSQDLSLKVLSSHFNINASYLGQLFKHETGDMFSNYLNKVRIEKAKLILIDSKLNAAEVSEKVGYLSANYFYNMFKKYVGVYPTDYKRRKLE